MAAESDLVYRLRVRSSIRRQIMTRKSVQEGKPDRIADLLDEAATEIEQHRLVTPVSRSDQWIVCAAVQMTFCFHDGTSEIRTFCSPRHWDVVMRSLIGVLDEAYYERKVSEVQGFIDQRGNFLTREQAWLIAQRNGQIKYRCGADEYQLDGVLTGRLFSENLY